jgi:hypothetical protein
MKRVLVALLMIAGAAHGAEVKNGDVGFRLDVPDGFKANQEALPEVLKAFHDPARMLGVGYHAGGMAFSTEGKGAVLFVLYRVTNDNVADPGPMIRAEIEDFLARPGAVQIASRVEKIDPKVALVQVDYKPEAHLYSRTKAILYVDDQGVVYDVRMECTVTEEHLDDLAPKCGAAIDSFGVAQPVEMLKDLKVPPPPKPVAKADAGPPAAPEAASVQTLPEAHTDFPVKVTAEAPSALPRLFIYGGMGLIGLAVVFLLLYKRKGA